MPAVLSKHSIIAGLLASSLSFAPHVLANIDDTDIEGDTALSSEKPHIPEPMVFDLVRPLGVQQGEAEVNALMLHNLSESHTEWAPEFEIGLLDDLALELELPFENSRIEAYKVALQGTWGSLLNQRAIHGWQLIGYYNRERHTYTFDALYILGLRLGSRFSSLSMMGLRRDDLTADGAFVGLFNTSGFYDFSQQVTLGLEMNTEFHANGKWNYLLMPQLHYDFASHTTLQLGAGVTKDHNRKPEFMTGLRLIYAF